jgi:hypothetical protein
MSQNLENVNRAHLFAVQFDRGAIPAPAAQMIRGALQRGVASHRVFKAEVENQRGLEIARPSGIFRDTGELALYRHAVGLDNVCILLRKRSGKVADFTDGRSRSCQLALLAVLRWTRKRGQGSAGLV